MNEYEELEELEYALDLYDYYKRCLDCNGNDTELAIAETSINFMEDEETVREAIKAVWRM